MSRARQRVRIARASIKSQVSSPRFFGLSSEASRETSRDSSLHPRRRRCPCCGRSRITSDGRRMTRLGHLWYLQTFSSPTAASRTPWWSDDRFDGCRAVPKGLFLVRALLGSKPVHFPRHDSPRPRQKALENTWISMLFGLAGFAPEIFSPRQPTVSGFTTPSCAVRNSKRPEGPGNNPFELSDSLVNNRHY